MVSGAMARAAARGPGQPGESEGVVGVKVAEHTRVVIERDPAFADGR